MMTADEWRERIAAEKRHSSSYPSKHIWAIGGGWGTPVTRDELAALALYGQPFGFTHDDVAVIRRMAEQEDELFGDGAGAKRLASLADRIEALLPHD